MLPPVDEIASPKLIDSEEAIARDVAAIGRIDAVPSLLRVVCDSTGMGFAAVARVTDGTWTACAVQDSLEFGLKPGGQLDLHTTLCKESRAARQPVVIDHASLDPLYCGHHTPRIYKIESYISVPIIKRNGDYFGNLCAIDPRPRRLSDARTVAMFTHFADLIAFHLESEERQQATESALSDARATAELREQFIAVLGHDLRNPLSAVAATAEVLARSTAQPEVAAMGHRLKSSTRRMSRLIDDVMDFARSRLGGGMEVSIAQCDDITAALHEVVGELKDANPRREVIENIAIDGPVHCDRDRVQQLLSNLLGNALTHGAPDQPVVVDAFLDGGDLVLAVSNRGEPVPPADLEKVFEPYWRPASSRRGGGLGLGLHICSQIARAHGGSVGAESSAVAGTRFVARVPAGVRA